MANWFMDWVDGVRVQKASHNGWDMTISSEDGEDVEITCSKGTHVFTVTVDDDDFVAKNLCESYVDYQERANKVTEINLFGHSIELDRIVEVSIPANDLISTQGVQAIVEILTRYGYKMDYPDDWAWKWSVGGKGEYVGTLPKRLAKLYYNTTKGSIDSTTLAKVGEIAVEYMVAKEPHTYLIDFTQNFNWVPGDFGDSGSCYWGAYNNARAQTLPAFNAIALRFYKASKTPEGMSPIPPRGIGRIWLYQTKDKNCYVMFNAYGPYQGLKMAKVLAMMLGVSYKHIKMSQSRNPPTGALYINNGQAWLIGSAEDLDNVESYDVFRGFKNYDCKCSSCNKNLRMADPTNFDFHGYNGEVYRVQEVEGFFCRACADKQHILHCESCGEFYLEEKGSAGYCPTCYPRFFQPCACCHKMCRTRNMERYPTMNDRNHMVRICDDCAGSSYRVVHCVTCKVSVFVEEGTDVNQSLTRLPTGIYGHACTECQKHMERNESGMLELKDKVKSLF